MTTATPRTPAIKRLKTPNHQSFALTVKQAAPSNKKWFVVDGDGQIVGRLATKIATVLMGKHKPDYTANVDSGDYVVVVNIERVRFSGRQMTHPSIPYFTNKTATKLYQRFSGFPSGRKTMTAADRLIKKPDDVLMNAVRRMLPKTKLGRDMLAKLRLFTGPTHPHQAQQPTELPAFLK